MFHHPFSVVTLLLAILCTSVGFAEERWVALTDGDSQPLVTVLQSDNRGLTVRWEISGFYRSTVTAENRQWDKIRVDNRQGAGFPGEPELPYLFTQFALPDGHIAVAELLSAEWEILPGDYTLFPLQTPPRDGEERATKFTYLESAYSQVTPLPATQLKVGDPGGWGGVLTAAVAVAPFKYYPVFKQLQVAKSLTVRINFVPGNAPQVVKPSVTRPLTAQMHAHTLLNPPPSPAIARDDGNEPVRILFVLNAPMREFVQPLVDFHHTSGLRADVWEVPRDIEPLAIKEEVRRRYQLGLEYLFLIGDGYAWDPDVPMYHWNPPFDPMWKDAVAIDTHSDTWYVCLDPQHVIRDTLYDDHRPELAVGRLVYHNSAELALQVDKTLKYINWEFQNQDAGWLANSLLIAASGEYTTCKEDIETYNYALPSPDFETCYFREADANNQKAINFINGNGVGILNYRGHGTETAGASWKVGQSINADFVRALQNVERPFIYIASACLNGDIAKYNGGDRNCILESFQKAQWGAVASHGSVISTYTWGNTDFDIGIFREWFDNGIYSIGGAAMVTMNKLVNKWDATNTPGVGRMNTRAYIWLGDPALEYRFGSPLDLEASIPEGIEVGAMFTEITIKHRNNPVSGVRVCLRSKDDAVYKVAETNEEGLALFLFDPPLDRVQDDILLWTVYHRNGKPLNGVINIIGENAPVNVTVKAHKDNAPIPGAIVSVKGFGIAKETDEQGRVQLSKVPIGDRTLIAGAVGWLNDTISLQVAPRVDNDTLSAVLLLKYTQLVADSFTLQQHMRLDTTVERLFSFSNSGDGNMLWSSELYFPPDAEPYQLVKSYLITLEDRRLKGALFIDGFMYVAGGNNNSDPNYLYKLDRDGKFISSWEQPSSGFGFYDMVYDGQIIWCAGAGKAIYKLDMEGNVLGQINGPFNDYNKSLTMDADGNLLVGKDTEPIYVIDKEGNPLKTIPNSLNIRGLAWLPNAKDDYPLMVSTQTVHGSDLFKMNPVNGSQMEVSDLSLAGNELLADGLSITNQYDPPHVSLMAVVNRDSERYIRLWDLSTNKDWIELDPSSLSGTTEPQAVSTITLHLNSLNSGDNVLLQAELIIRHNGRGGSVSIPVTVAVGKPTDVSPVESNSLPDDFAILSTYPNPFNSTTVVQVAVPTAGLLKVGVYDLNGRLVGMLNQSVVASGNHKFTFTATVLPSGVYIVRAEQQGKSVSRKIALVR